MKKFKKVAAGILAAISVATCVVGMSASAYSPTITGTFKVGNGSATKTLYADTSYAKATLQLSNGGSHSHVYVQLSYAGNTSYSNGVSSVSVRQDGNGKSTKAAGTYKATADTSNGYTTKTEYINT